MSTMMTIENGHAESCGEPPAWISEKPRGLRSYFENRHGDQWVSEATKNLFRLAGGDASWETRRVKRPNYGALLRQIESYMELKKTSGWVAFAGFQGIVFSHEECHWLVAVLCAAVNAYGGAK